MEPEDRAGEIRYVTFGVGGKGMGKGSGAGGYFFRELLIAESLRADFGDDGAEQVEQRQEFRRQTGIIEADIEIGDMVGGQLAHQHLHFYS